MTFADFCLERVVLRNVLRNHKALSPLLIALIVVVVTVVVVGAVVAYVWLMPGNLKTETKEFSNFTALEVGSAFEVTVTKSDTYSVKITAGERIFDRIQVTQTGETLKIAVEPGIILGTANMKAEITMPVLDRIDFSGATYGVADGFNSTEKFVVRLSGASALGITNLNVGDVDAELSGASHLTAVGSGNDLAAEVSGASNLDLTNFHVNDANVVVSGASHAIVNLDGRLDVEATGASSLEYIGDPQLGNINTSGASTVNKK